MISIRLKFRPSTVCGKEGSLRFLISRSGRQRSLPAGCAIFPEEWNGRRVVAAPGLTPERTAAVKAAIIHLRCCSDRLMRVGRRLEEKMPDCDIDDFMEAYGRYCREHSLSAYMTGIATRLSDNGHVRTAETYRAALNSFRRFSNGADIMLDEITSETMESYESHLKKRGNTPNTTSFYMRILRAVYNRAVDEGRIDDVRPFRRVYTGVEKTVKRALPLPLIRRIKALDLEAMPHTDYARDMFLLSFFMRGMSFVDMAYLRKTDLRHGRITYRRRKTGQLLTIEWTGDMQTILDKYSMNPTAYLLPIITRNGGNERTAYRNRAYYINRHLKTVAAMIGIDTPLTLYCARHSWATAAQTKGVPLNIISEGMGHDSEATTRIYLASIGNAAVDRVNRMILKCL